MIPRLISFHVTSKAARRKRLWGDASRIWDKGCLVYRRRRGIIHRYYYESKRVRESLEASRGLYVGVWSLLYRIERG